MAAFVGTNGNDTFIGTESNDSFEGRAGNDNMQGRGGNDAFNMSLGGTSSYGSDLIDGGTAYDTIWFDGYAVSGLIVDFAAGTISGGGVGGAGSVSFVDVERVIGGSSADQMTGSAIGQNLSGMNGNDTLRGAGGSDWIWGGAGADRIVYGEAGTAHADQIGDFTSGVDKVVLDGGMLGGLGAEGNFTAGDARFTANSSGTAQDAGDRIIYNTSTRQVFYDADGAGGASAQLIATLQSGANLVATDIAVEGGGSGGGGGTEGDDTLIGTAGPDTLDGRGGNDTILGLGGDDQLIGGTGNDLLDGGTGEDGLDGGVGDDTYVVLGDGDALTDAGGIDTVVAHNIGWDLAAGFENLTLTGDPIVGFFERGGSGNELDNVIRNDVPAGNGIWWLAGREGDDTVIGGAGREHFTFSSATGDYGHDSIDGRGGSDVMLVGESSAVVVDFAAGTLTGGGTGGAGSADFINVEIVSADAFDDLFVGGDADVTAYGGAGDDTFLGGAGIESFHDDNVLLNDGFSIDSGDDTLSGGGGDDWLFINRGNDAVDGGTGDDTVFIDAGFYFIDYGSDEIDGGAGLDTLSIMAASAITVDLGAGTMTGGGVGGSGSATLVGIENFDTTRGVGDFDHQVTGSAGTNLLSTRSGDDTLNGAGGHDVMGGGEGADVFVFDQSPGAAHADTVVDFVSGVDKLRLHASAMPALGTSGDFTAGDERFAANASGTAQDSSDRVVFDTTTAELFYDADGDGEGAALLIATLSGPTLAATDITVQGGSSGGGGTEGDDTIVGTEGNDVLRGFGGNDTIHGLGGNDVIIPGEGDDAVFAGAGNDGIAMDSGNFDQSIDNQGSDDIDGGAGVDFLGFSTEGVSTTQAVTIDLGAGTYSLAGPDPASGTVTGIENVQGSWFDDAMTGSSAANFLGGWSGDDVLNGRGGNDTLGDEGGGADVFVFDQTPGAAHADTVANFASDDQIRLDATVMPALGPSGSFSSGDARFAANSSGTAQDSSDRVVYNTTNGQLWYDADGNAAGAALLIATLQGAPLLAASDIEVVNGEAPTITLTQASNLPLSGDVHVDALLHAYLSWDFTGDEVIHYTFDPAAAAEATDYGNVRAYDATTQDSARLALSHAAAITGITFTETSDTDLAELHFAAADIPGLGLLVPDAHWQTDASGNVSGLEADGYVFLHSSTSGVIPGSFTYQTLLHEIGHALGLKHPHDLQLRLLPEDDHTGNTLMSSMSGGEILDEFQDYDVAALQWIYGGDGLGGAGAFRDGTLIQVGTLANDTLVGGPGHDWLTDTAGDDTLTGGEGNDFLFGGAGLDRLDGGEGDDRYGATAGDVIVDSSGTDWVFSEVDWTLAPGLENLVLYDAPWGHADNATGNSQGNRIVGNERENVIAGGAGSDILTGGPGVDRFLYAEAPGSANADVITDFEFGWQDELLFDAVIFTAIGATSFSDADERLHIASGAVSGVEPDDRIVYDTASGRVYYDADGSGGGAALLVVTLQGAPALNGAQIEVLNGSSQGQTITGTSGSDNLVGTDGDDTIDGLGGADTMDGRLGNDTYHVTTGDVLIDSGGSDTVVTPINWTLGLDFENLTMTGTASLQAQGNNSDNVVIGNSGNNYFNLRAGDDTIQAGAGNDVIDMSRGGTASYGNDVVDGGEHFDRIDFDGYASSGIVANFSTGTISGGGDGGAGSVSFSNIERIIGASFADSITGDGIGNHLDGRSGDDTLVGGGGDDVLWGGNGNDWLEGGTGNDWMNAGAGNDSFVFREAPGAGNADTIDDFASGADKIRLDDSAHVSIGAAGNFAAGDGRFTANSSGTAQDGADRVVYNTSTGQLYYDADGSGSGAVQLIATLDPGTALTATDIAVI